MLKKSGVSSWCILPRLSGKDDVLHCSFKPCRDDMAGPLHFNAELAVTDGFPQRPLI